MGSSRLEPCEATAQRVESGNNLGKTFQPLTLGPLESSASPTSRMTTGVIGPRH